VRKKNTAINAFYEALAVLNRPAIWAPLALYFVIKVAVIAAYRMTFLGPLEVVWGFLLSSDTRALLGHYPADLVHMSTVLQRAGILLGVLVGVFFEGATVILFANAFRDQAPSLKQAFRIALHRYRSLVGVALVVTLAVLAVTELPAYLFGLSSTNVSPKLLSFAGHVGEFFVRILLLYMMPLVLLTDRSVLKSVAESARWSWRSFGQTALLFVLPFLITLPTMIMKLQSATLIAQVEPEIVIPIEVMSEVTAWLATLLMTGAVTVWFIRRKGRELVV
jgi:hypothetical protein